MQLLENMSGITQQKMLFFHHILEMIYFGVPLGATSLDIFELVTAIQQHLSYICTKTRLQKISLGKLLLLLGADVDGSVESILQQILQAPDILHMLSIDIDQTSEHALEGWIHNYIQTHPCAHMFKTIHFLSNVRD